MRDFRWRARARRARTQPLLALPGWVGTGVLVVLVIVACGFATTVVRPEVDKFMAAAQTSAPPTDTAEPPRPTRTPGATATRPNAAPTAGPATAVVAPPTAAPTAVVVPTEPPADTPVPTAAPGVISVGATVQVGGTNGIGLSLRAGPSIGEPLVRVAAEGEQLTIIEGPVDADGYTWWKVHNDQGGDGWGAASFMTVVTP